MLELGRKEATHNSVVLESYASHHFYSTPSDSADDGVSEIPSLATRGSVTSFFFGY
jgi:hypothetical protein